jgi:hypothetical protein
MHLVLTRTPNNRQEDAHEYISWLLAAADDEMHAAMNQQRAVVAGLHDDSAAEAKVKAKAKAAAASESEADGQWETVGKRSSGGGVVTQIISRSRFELLHMTKYPLRLLFTAFYSTPLALIFSGSLATSVHRQVGGCHHCLLCCRNMCMLSRVQGARAVSVHFGFLQLILPLTQPKVLRVPALLLKRPRCI